MTPWRFAANLDWLYPDRPFLDRFAAARADGFDAVELLQPHRHPLGELLARLEGLQVALINAPAGDWDAGERGLAALPGREADFRTACLQGIELATRLGAPCLHLLSGLNDDTPATRACWLQNLRWAAEHGPPGLTLTVEPINRRDMPGYFLHRQPQAHELLDALAHPRVGLQLDLYHCRIAEGESLTHLQHALARGRLAHVQVAGETARKEPQADEYAEELALLTQRIWHGAVGLEYRPAGDTSAGLAWLQGHQTD
ncbi:hydroxypyruvate isomerase family protein [Inhella sp.]|uniref:hydroxypyruvate isomerase family protein n=1 Tax=Inhella sp. TaxID=1921806 RepID=UPI0035B40D9E